MLIRMSIVSEQGVHQLLCSIEEIDGEDTFVEAKETITPHYIISQS